MNGRSVTMEAFHRIYAACFQYRGIYLEPTPPLEHRKASLSLDSDRGGATEQCIAASANGMFWILESRKVDAYHIPGCVTHARAL